MATTPFGFAVKMRDLSTRVPAGLPRAVLAAGRIVERSVDVLAPDRLRNVGRSGARIGTRTLPPRRTGSDASAVVRATGAFHLVEHPSRAHVIIPKRTGRGRGSRQAKKQSLYDSLFGGAGGGLGAPALKLPDGGLRHRVQHPGVRSPSRPFARGVAIAAPHAPQVFHEALVLDIASALR